MNISRLRALSWRPALLVGLTLALAGCASMEEVPDASAEPPAPAVGGPATAGAAPEPAPGDVAPVDGEEEEAAGPILYRGTGEMVRMPANPTPIRYRGEAVSLDFEQAPLTEVVHAIMGDILKMDYIVEHPISGEVTLRTRRPVPRDQLLDILESLLKANNALMIRDNEGRFFVSGSGQMSRLKPSVASSTAGVAGYSTIIVPLTHISANAMAEILRPVADDTAFVRIDNLRNLLMLAGTRAQLEGWQEIIDTFDVDLLAGMSVGVFPIENTSIEEIDVALAALMSGSDEGGDSSLIGAGGLVKMIPLERLSSIMVVARRNEYLQRIGMWIERLDREPDANFERRLHVYPVQNSNAAHLANLISGVFGGSLGGGSSAGSSSSGTAPGLTPEAVTDGGAAAQSAQRPVSRGPQAAEMGDVRVVADDENNALLIYATAREYKDILPALEQLDVAATQVIIEASIIEVTLNETLKYGIDWTFESGGLDGGFRGTGQLIAGEALGAIVPGFSYSVVNAAGDVRAVLNTLAEDDLLNVISSPSIMVLDNQTAEIQVGDQVPIETANATAEGFLTTSVEYRDTGVQLSVTPSVNAGGMVTMDIEQSVTDVNATSTSANQPTFLERSIVSRVAVRSSESIVLGGLIRDNKTQSSSGIPLLHELPLIGAFFGTKGTDNRRTELLVIITPRVIFNDSELRDVSREMRSQMRGLELLGESDLPAFLSDSIKKETSTEE